MAGITRVVLYKHGVGYFERVEDVEGAAEVRLTFRANDMNDVLKSLTLHDLNGGQVSSVSYDTLKPVDKLLEEVALDIPSEGGIAALLASVRGARVAITAGNRKLEGQVVGVEQTSRQFAEGLLETPVLTLLGPEGFVQTVDLTEVSGLTFQDDHIRKDLAYYFDTLIHSYKRDSKSLSIHTDGTGQRKLQVSYIIESPVWKTSYRILLSDLKANDPPFLEGWALVDNVQDEDWIDVDLSLVSGLPISFTHDLYSPRYIQRREVRVEREASAGPVMTEAAMPPAPPMSAPASFAAEVDLLADRPRGGGGALRKSAGRAPGQAAAVGQRVAQSTVTQSLGDLFEYSISHPVTVKRNQSALVPIVAKELSAKRIVFYNQSQRSENPFAAVDLTNSTGLTLEGGPLVVFEGDTYAGEAMLDTLKPDETRIVAFAVDLGVSVETEHDFSVEDVTAIVARSGYLSLRSATITHRYYKLTSKDDRVRTCCLEHPISPGARLHDTREPDEKTHSFYRFRFELPARQTTVFRISELADNVNAIDIRTVNREALGYYVSRRYLSLLQEEQLSEVVGLSESLAKLTNKLNESRQQIAQIGTDQTRLRSNLQSLGTTSDQARLRARYVEKLETQETELEQFDLRIKKLQQEIESRRAEVDRAISKIEFETLLSPEPVHAVTAEPEPLEEPVQDTEPEAGTPAEEEPPTPPLPSPSIEPDLPE